MVRGDVTDDVLDISITLTNETIFVVSSHRVNNATGHILADGSTNYRIAYQSIVNSVFRTYNAMTSIVTGGFVETDFHIIRAVHDGTDNILTVNNGTPNSNAVASGSHTYTSLFARTAAGAVPIDGDIAEVLIYDRSLSDTEIAQVENYLSSKWGITLS